MAVGDYVIRRNATNTDVVPAAGSDLLLDWPTAVANVGSGITHSGGVFTLGETGHFLVMCSDHAHSVNNTNNERIGYKSTFTLAGVELVEGYCHAYIRKNNTALLDYITFSAAIINVTTTTGTGDELEVRLERNDDVVLTGPVRVVDDRSGITIIKLDDTWGYGRYQSSAVTATSATDNVRTVMNIQTQDEQDSPFTRTTNTIDIATGNLVLAVYSTKSEDATSAGRSEFQSNLFLNSAALDGSWNQQYSRNSQDGGWAGSSNVVLLNPTSGWDLDVGIVSRDGGGEDFSVAIQLVELPAGAEAIILESAAGNYNPTAATNFSWPNAPAYIDTPAFTFSQPATNIDVDNAGDYLVMAAMGDSTDAGTAATRAMPALQFRVNTTDIEHAGSTTYHRNNTTSDHSSLACATLLTGLAADDSIHCRHDRLGPDVGSITNSAGQFAVIRLSSLFAASAISGTPDLAFSIPTADLEAQGKLDATAALVFAGATVDLEGKGKLDASSALAFNTATADLKADGKLDATAALVFGTPTADIKAGGKLDATAALVFAAATALLRGTGLLGATAALAFGVPSANLDFAPSLISATPDLVISATADLKAAGKLDGTPDLVFAVPTADLEATGKLDASLPLVFSATADLEGTGKLDASPDLVFTIPTAGLVNSTPAGSIDASPDLIFTATADLEGTGKLDATAAAVFSATADLKGLGALNATPDLTFGITADLNATGKLDATAAVLFGATADLIGRGKLDATAALVFSQTADLTAIGVLSATPSLAFAQTADLKGAGRLSATCAMAFSVPTASLIDITAVQFIHIDITAVLRTIAITGIAGRIN